MKISRPTSNNKIWTHFQALVYFRVYSISWQKLFWKNMRELKWNVSILKTSKNKWCTLKYASLNFYHIFIAISIYEENTLHLKIFLLQGFTYIWIKTVRLNKPPLIITLVRCAKPAKQWTYFRPLLLDGAYTVFLHVSGQKELPNFPISFVNVPFTGEPIDLFIIVDIFGIMLCHFIISSFNMQWTFHIVIGGLTSH